MVRARHLSLEIGHQLAALPCELVWATTWEDEDNVEIGPRIGLPQLPVVSWPEPSASTCTRTDGSDCAGKPGPWSTGRPFAWVDDEITDADRRWVSTHHPAARFSITSSHSAGSGTRTSQPSINGCER